LRRRKEQEKKETDEKEKIDKKPKEELKDVLLIEDITAERMTRIQNRAENFIRSQKVAPERPRDTLFSFRILIVFSSASIC